MAPTPGDDAIDKLDIEGLDALLRAHCASMGFWNAPGDQGSWRVVATWRHGGNPGPDSERATVLTWDNATAQSLARRMLGMEPEGNLPWIFCAAHCARALAFEAALWTAELFEKASFCESIAGHRDAESADDGDTRRLLVFNEEELVHLAAGFEAVAAATGGRALHSHPELERDARALASRAAPFAQPFDPRSAARFEEPQPRAEASDLFGLELADGRFAHFDMRSAALALGSGVHAAFARPTREGWSLPFLDAMSGKRAARGRLPEALSLGAHVELRDGPGSELAARLLTELRQASLLKADLNKRTPCPTPRKARSL